MVVTVWVCIGNSNDGREMVDVVVAVWTCIGNSNAGRDQGEDSMDAVWIKYCRRGDDVCLNGFIGLQPTLGKG